MPCEGRIVVYHQVEDGARFDLCVDGTATWVGQARVFDDDPETPVVEIGAERLQQPCGDDAGARLDLEAGTTYIVEIEIPVVEAGTLEICHAVVVGDRRHRKSCCWNLNVEAGDLVDRKVILLVP